ncbi:MAG: prepilin-type N-terminal cleavage/methylation domain-containing protein [Limisphaerales bacterium]
MKTSIASHRLNRTLPPLQQPQHAFTLIELAVVVGTLAVLALVLAPALAGTKMDAMRLQCQNNLRQLQVGMQLFTQDHNDMFPPAGYQSSGGQLTWDSWIYSYISGGQNVTVSQAAQGVYAVNSSDAAALGLAVGLPVLACPVDATLPKIYWMHVNGDPTQPLQYAVKTYEMNSVGPSATWEPQVVVLHSGQYQYPLPDLNQPGCHGVGIYWMDLTTSGLPDWDAKGYKTSVVKDPAGTILLCEDASSQGCEGNQWPCCCFGPLCSGGSFSSLYQIDLAAPTSAASLQNASTGYSEGLLLYPAHGNRFNYLFHDGHVEALPIEQTIGSGTLTAPKGMWTVVPGD